MKSIISSYKTWHKDESYSLIFSKEIELLEDEFYQTKNSLADAKEEIKELQWQLKQSKEEVEELKSDDVANLTSISKKMSKVLKGNGEKAMIQEIALERAKILDHFSLAYLADSGLEIGNLQLVQGVDPQTGMFEIYFTKKTKIIL